MEEEELESFRRKWREEVSQRGKNRIESGDSEDAAPIASSSGPGRPSQNVPPVSSHHRQRESVDVEGEFEPQNYHDLENKEELLKLGVDGKRGEASSAQPVSALDHYEKAVERESAGSLGDSVSLYRKAFKVDCDAQKLFETPTHSSSAR